VFGEVVGCGCEEARVRFGAIEWRRSQHISIDGRGFDSAEDSVLRGDGLRRRALLPITAGEQSFENGAMYSNSC